MKEIGWNISLIMSEWRKIISKQLKEINPTKTTKTAEL
jgi:hypothetical protein